MIRVVFKEAVLFAVGGALNAAVYVGVAFGLNGLAHLDALAATSAGYVSSMVVSFFFNANFTFQGGNPKSLVQAFRFAILYGVGYAYNVAFIWWSTTILTLSFFEGVVLITITWPVISFTLSKFVVFH